MRRKCAFCGKVKKVSVHSIECNGRAYCSRSCAWSDLNLSYISRCVCERCGTPIRMNAVVKSAFNAPDTFYCCEKCMMDDLGLKLMEDSE